MAINSNGNYLFTGTQYGGFYRSANQGGLWNKIEDGEIRGTGGIASRGDTVIIMTEDGLMFSKDQGTSFTGITSPFFFGGNSILICNKYVFVGSTQGVWRRPLSSLHAYHLMADSLVLKKTQNDIDSILLECDTTWTIYGYMPDFLSADHLSGSGDSYIVFRTLLENPGNNERMNAFTIVSGRGNSTSSQ